MNLKPAIPKCFFCGKDKNEILLNRILTDKEQNKMEELHGKVIDMEPCDECKKIMKQGIMCFSIKDGDECSKNPYRTGKMAVVKDEALSKMIEDKQLLEQIIEARFVFIPDTVFDALFANIDFNK